MNRQHPYALTLAVAMTLAAAATARAQEAAPADETAAQSAVMEEIVVTAQKREESVQDVPISMQAFTGQTLENAEVNSVISLSRLVPNFDVKRGAQTANIRMSIRGIGAAGNTGVDPSVGAFMDGIYVARPGAMFASFNDISAAEVLRGPQGTLFGRNATVGAINLRSNDPGHDWAGSVGAQVGNYGWQQYTGMLNAPVGDRLAFRVAGLYESTDGFTKNTVTGKDNLGNRDLAAFRVGGTWDITDSLSWTVKYDYSKIDGDGYQDAAILPGSVTPANLARLTQLMAAPGHVPGSVPMPPPDVTNPSDHKTNQYTEGDLDDKQWGLSSNLSWEVGDGYTLRLLSGYRDWQNEQYEADVLFMTRPMLSRLGGYDSTSTSQELQIISPVDKLLGGRLDYVAGLYYFHEDFKILEQLGMLNDFCDVLFIGAGAGITAARNACIASPNKPNASVLNFKQDSTNYAVYGQANFRLFDPLTLVVGGRYTWDDKSGAFDQQVPNPIFAPRVVPGNPFGQGLRVPEYDKLKTDSQQDTWRVGLNITPTDDMLFFLSYSTGYKSGGFNSGGGTTALGAERRTFDPETSTDYELGTKLTLAGGMAHFNITFFQMDLHDFQDRAFDGTSFNVINAGNLRQQGYEVDADYAFSNGIRLYGALGYIDSEFTKYPNASCLPGYPTTTPPCTQNLDGVPATYSPKYTMSLGTEAKGDLGIGDLGYLFRADWRYVSETNINAINDNNPQGKEPAWNVLSARLALTFGEDRRYSVAVYGENLTDSGYCVGRFGTPFGQQLGLTTPATGEMVMRCAVAEPRTYGLALNASF